MARKNSIFSGKKNSPKKQAALLAEVQRNHERAMRQQQRREMNRLAKEVIAQKSNVYTMSRSELISYAMKAQKVLDWRAQQQADVGYKTGTIQYYEKFRKDREVRQDSKMIMRSLQSTLGSYINYLQNRKTIKTAAKEDKAAMLAQTRDYLGLNRVTQKQAAKLWEAIDKARAIMTGADWSDEEERYRDIQEAIQGAVADWKARPRKFQSIDDLTDMIVNAVLQMEEPITPEFYDSAVKEYQKSHPNFQGPLDAATVRRYGHAFERI